MTLTLPDQKMGEARAVITVGWYIEPAVI